MHVDRISELITALETGLYQRDEVLRLTLLGVLSAENVFLYGPTGSAKGLLARRMSQAIAGSRHFSYVISEQTLPDEVFGPISVTKLRDYDLYERATQGYLPEAEIAYLDNVWSATGMVRNALGLLLDERVFRNGTQLVQVPLITLLASDAILPDDSAATEALADQFVLRVSVEGVSDRDAFVSLISDTTPPEANVVPEELRLSASELSTWRTEALDVTVPEAIASLIFDVRERIQRHNLHHRTEEQSEIVVSDRRWKRAMNLLRTSAFLNGRTEVDALDAILLRHCLWTREDQIEPVNTIVGEAIHRYVTSGRFEVAAMRERLRKIIGELKSDVSATENESVEEPVVYRDEYFRLEGFPAESEVLIWIADFEQLSSDRETETDLFFYGEEDDYAYSERVLIRRVSDSRIEVDGEEKAIETETRTVTTERPVEVEPDVRTRWLERLQELEDSIDTTIAEIVRYRDDSSGEAVRHLFVHRSYAQIVLDGMDEAAGAFADLKEAVRTARSRVEE